MTVRDLEVDNEMLRQHAAALESALEAGGGDDGAGGVEGGGQGVAFEENSQQLFPDDMPSSQSLLEQL